jgi:hypothetical protein
MSNKRRPSCAEQQRAYFLAGHAVAAFLEGLEVVRLLVEPERDGSAWLDIREPDLTRVRLRSSDRARDQAKSVIRALLTGPAAQIRYSFGPHPIEFSLSNKYLLYQQTVWRAVALAGKFAEDGPALIHASWAQATILIQDRANWAAIDAVAEALLNGREVPGHEVYEIVRRATRR